MPRFSLARIWTPRLYSRIARHYDRLAWLIAPQSHEAQRRMLADLEGGRLLDVGCGTGTLLALAQERGLETFGIDTSDGMLTEARRKVPRARLNKASFYQLPFAEESFDYVVETHALSGVGLLTERAIIEMLRVCKSGGEVRLVDYAQPPNRSWIHAFIETAGILIGDYPYDYIKLFSKLGYHPQVEILGGHDMYQYLRVIKKG